MPQTWTVLIVALFFFALPGLTAAAEPLTVTLSLFRIQLEAQGKEELIPAPSVKPGDLVEYQAVYVNVSDQPLRNVQATLPLPDYMEYLGGSAFPVSVMASADGLDFGPEPLMRLVPDKEGKIISEPVPFSEYKALRWQIPLLEAGKEITVKARAKISMVILNQPVITGEGEAAAPGGGK